MNILVLGNGFDLAHDLPTSYRAFLNFTTVFKECLKKENDEDVDWVSGENLEMKQYLRILFDKKYDTAKVPEHEREAAKKIIAELDDLIRNNVWLKYFNKVQIKEGWIDFESEISRIIQALDGARQTIDEQIQQGKDNAKMTQSQLNILSPIISRDGTLLRCDSIFFEPKAITYRKKQLLDDLNRLIRCLEIYLCDYVGNIEIENKHPDIEGLPIIDKVLSFNYTNTYEKLYAKNPYVEYDYIHGRATIENTVDSNNMVLGIDEYLKGAARNENIEFIEFKKFFQRIHKETGCLYRNWVDAIESGEAISETIAIYKEQEKTVRETKQVNFHKVFFFGHSLDVTDKDVIRDMILSNKVKTTIFYRDKADYGQKITNLVKIIGQDELIKRTGGANKSIYFKEITKE